MLRIASLLSCLRALPSGLPRLARAVCLVGAGTSIAQAQQPQPGFVPQPAKGVTLTAVFATENKPIRSGITWRVLSERGEGQPEIIARSDAAQPNFILPPGSYTIHATYGFASGLKRIIVPPSGTLNDRMVVNAGALKLAGTVADSPIPANRLTFSVFVPLQGNSEGRLVVANAKAGEVIRLPDGTYHVVSTYGDSNAVQRADVKVDSGKLTEATLYHRAARVTLKLVTAPGGEAFAGTAYSVLTPGGDVIREAIGAFAQVTLAEGNYVLIARHDGDIFTRDFKVETGLDRDIEVVAKRN
jgi:hypothetical protein